jgi:alpha/beta hydrolase family protein
MLESLDVHRVIPVDGWAYDWVSATARFAVAPGAPANARIADLDLAPAGPDGLVRFDADVRLLRPRRSGGPVPAGNGRMLLVVPNRGMTGGVPFSLDAPLAWGPSETVHPGDGFLLEQGWTIAWCGWQWDVLRDEGWLGLGAPVAEVEPGWLRVEFRPDTAQADHALGDSSELFRFADYPTADVDDPDAVLTVRTTPLGEKRLVPRDRWRFGDATRVALDGGFQPFHWYELVYRSAFAPVAGTGLLAVRDLVSHLRRADDLVDPVEHALAFGVSQSGRFLRQFLFDGLNLDEDGRQVFDGVFAHIASARRGEFNARYAQPALTHPLTPGYGPPYDTASLLERQRSAGGVPKVVLTNSAWEYWRGDGALVHQDARTGDDLPEDPDARAYLVAGTDHMGPFPLKESMPTANPIHHLDASPVLRALFVQLDRWACDGVEPPPSRVPRRADGTAVDRASVLARFHDAARPDVSALPWTPAIEPASDSEPTAWPRESLERGEPLVALVSDVDATGNEVAGIRLPAVAAPVAAYSGWNPRVPVDGLPDVLYEFVGSRLSLQSGRPVADRAAYRAEALAAAEALVAARVLLERDVERTVDEALRFYDAR